MYFTQEGQFRNYFEKAARTKGVTGEFLLQQLERRLDNVVLPLGICSCRAARPASWCGTDTSPSTDAK